MAVHETRPHDRTEGGVFMSAGRTTIEYIGNTVLFVAAVIATGSALTEVVLGDFDDAVAAVPFDDDELWP